MVIPNLLFTQVNLPKDQLKIKHFKEYLKLSEK